MSREDDFYLQNNKHKQQLLLEIEDNLKEILGNEKDVNMNGNRLHNNIL